MRFEETSLTDYLVKHLQTLTPADPVILAEYVVALLKNDKSTVELQKLCTDNLVEFLGQSAQSFIAKLFQDIENGLIVKPGESFDAVGKLEPSRSPIRVENLHVSGSPRQEMLSASESTSEPEDKEVTDDDDDDDRNHKHRRREARPTSLEKETPDQIVRRPNRKGNRPYGNGQLFMATDPLSNDIQKGYNPSVERDLSSKFHDHRDSGPRARLSQGYRADSCSRFDLSSSIDRRPVGRGRGRNTVPWNQPDPRFNPLETLDFGSQISSQGHQHPNLFLGTGLPNAASSQNPSWGAFGLIPGMSSGILDPLHPLSLQGTLHPPINTPMSIGVPRQRCRDFEERGFCLRGDMCPMEHGVNRIVVEDVQSLSQFNLPVSITSSRAMGIQAGTGSSSHVMNRALAGKSNKSELADDELNKNGLISAPSGAEADVYDPDQPLWNNDRHKTSSALLRFSSPNIDDGPILDGNSLVRHNPEFSDNNQSELLARNFSRNIGPQSTTSSVLGQIGSSNNPATANNKMTTAGYLGKILGDDHDKSKSKTPAPSQVKDAATEGTGIKEITSQSAPRMGKDFSRSYPKASQKALRTLYVNGIPKKCNRRELLLSHFQKFGEVIDIYIPVNSEKAFVQFSKREEAEAALKAPDAVMGNRFIKLWWANRDSIPDEGQTNAYAKSKQHLDALVPLVPSRSMFVESVAQKENGPAAEKSLPVIDSPKNLVTNVPKALPLVPKKLESLENLKEEIRRKQEMLAQKRDDFRRQLDRLEKQAGVVPRKGELISVQAVKRQKMDDNTDVANSVIPTAANLTLSSSQEGENFRRNGMGEIIVSSTSATNSTNMQQSSTNIEQMSVEPVFKLDEHPNSFRILSPLPPDLANVAALREHFSSFGDLSSVVLEEPESCTSDVGLEISSKRSACVTFSTCESAQRAFLTANCWQGHNLQFKWLAFSSTPGNECDTLESSLSSTSAGAPDPRFQAESIMSGTSLDLEKLACSSTCVPAAIRTGEHTIHNTNSSPEPAIVFPVETSQSSPAIVPCGKGSSKSNV